MQQPLLAHHLAGTSLLSEPLIDPELGLEELLVQSVVSKPKPDPDLVQPIQKPIALRDLQRLPGKKRFHRLLGLSFQLLAVGFVARPASGEVECRRRPDDVLTSDRVDFNPDAPIWISGGT